MSPSTSGTFEPGYQTQDGQPQQRRSCGFGKRSWSFWEVALIVGAFIVFWPLGILALGWKFVKGELWPGSAQSTAPWKGFNFKGPDMKRWNFRDDLSRNSSGNFAFDAYKSRELARLEEERRRLAEEQRAFGDFLERLKQAKDQDEFDRFMSERRETPPPANS